METKYKWKSELTKLNSNWNENDFETEMVAHKVKKQALQSFDLPRHLLPHPPHPALIWFKFLSEKLQQFGSADNQSHTSSASTSSTCAMMHTHRLVLAVAGCGMSRGPSSHEIPEIAKLSWNCPEISVI